MIIAGDFNSWSDNRMLAVKELVKILALSKLENAVNNKIHIFGQSIDHVFYRQLTPLKHHVHQVSSSDHNPIFVNFKLKIKTLQSLISLGIKSDIISHLIFFINCIS